MQLSTNELPGTTSRATGPILVTVQDAETISRSLAGRAPTLFPRLAASDPIATPYEDALDALTQATQSCLRAFEEGESTAERTERIGGVKVHVGLYEPYEDPGRFHGEYSIDIPAHLRVPGLEGRLRRHLLKTTERKVDQQPGSLVGTWSPPRAWIEGRAAARESA